MCVLSACLLLTVCATFAWERPNSNLQKHTVVNCQSWSLSCYPPLRIKKTRLTLWCAGTSVLLGAMPSAFLCIHPPSVWLTSVKSLHKWMLSSLHEMVLSLKKNTQHSKHTGTKQRSDVDVGVSEICERSDKRESRCFFLFVFFMACKVLGGLFKCWSNLTFSFIIFYLCQGGYVFTRVHLFIGLSAGLHWSWQFAEDMRLCLVVPSTGKAAKMSHNVSWRTLLLDPSWLLPESWL